VNAVRPTSVAPISSRPPVPPSPARQWSRTLVVTGLLGALAALMIGPLWQVYWPVAVGTMLFTVLFSCAGVILYDEPGQRRTGVLLLLAGQLWALGWSQEWAIGPFPFISGPCSYAAISMAAWAMFRYPDPALMNRLERAFLSLVALATVGGILADNLTVSPRWRDYDPELVWWVALRVDRSLNAAVVAVVHQVQLVLVGLFIAVWALRIRRIRGLDRETVAPMAVASPVLAVVAGALPVAEALNAPVFVINRIYAVQAVVLGLIPLTFLVSVIRRRLADHGVLTMIGRLQRRPTPEAVQTALRQALRDDTLRVRYWAPDLNSYVDVTGAPILDPSPEPDRLLLPVTTPIGGPLALIEADPVLTRHPQVLANALAASGLALENAQLQAAVLGRLGQVRQVRAQAVQAGAVERRRVERNLHDGAQQRLLALRLVLAAADSPDLPAGSRQRLHTMNQEIALALSELRDLARGIHPAVLSQAGLSAAVEAVAQAYPEPVDAVLPGGRFPAATEETVYHLICAALERRTGAPEPGPRAAPDPRTAPGSTVGSGATAGWGSDAGSGPGGSPRPGLRIRGHREGGVLTIELQDEARDPDQLRSDTELPGMLDRVRALGGDVIFSKLARGGALMVVAVPCP